MMVGWSVVVLYSTKREVHGAEETQWDVGMLIG